MKFQNKMQSSAYKHCMITCNGYIEVSKPKKKTCEWGKRNICFSKKILVQVNEKVNIDTHKQNKTKKNEKTSYCLY